MAKKGLNAVRLGQAYTAAPIQPKALGGRSSSYSRKPAVTFQKQDHEFEDTENDEQEEEAEGEDENMVEMLVMLKEFQKRKASKTSARSVAFQNQKAMLFADARKRAEKAVREGFSSVEKARATILDLKAQEVSQEGNLASLKVLWESQDECVQGLLRDCCGIVEDLAHRRAEEIDQASAMLELQAAERERSRRRLVENARTCIEENLESQKVATDAKNLIKHYKALLNA